ncbi:MAG: ABC transporter ATP-binding protein [Deltaproteobacteria bacterium]|nr:MAG: ABC transporter ATP-binding protein [Deltaproteobacteria bacterium]
MARGRPFRDASGAAPALTDGAALPAGGTPAVEVPAVEVPAGDTPAIEVIDLRRRFGAREALAGASFAVARGELFGFLGPNGGGKSTLFRILATLLPPDGGAARVLGHDVTRAPDAVRRLLGVVFQHASVDGKLTVEENLRHHGRLYGLRGPALAARIDALLLRLGLAERARELVERLSGGLRRRVELAKGLLPRPAVLLLDEPSTGLDPAARRDFLAELRALRDAEGVTVVLTTHHMEEAERCDRVAILDRGRVVALGPPDALKASVGGDVLVVETPDAEALRDAVRGRFGVVGTLVDGTLRLERARAHELVREIVEAFPDAVRSLTYGKPTLEDVFVQATGRRFVAGGEA